MADFGDISHARPALRVVLHKGPRATRGRPSGSDCWGDPGTGFGHLGDQTPPRRQPDDGTEGSSKNRSFRENRGRRRQSSDSRGSRSGQGGFAPRPGRLALLTHALARPGTRERGPAHQALAALLLVDALGFRLSRFCALTHKSILSESVPRSTASVAAQHCFKSMTPRTAPLLCDFLTLDAVLDSESSDPATICPLILLIIVRINKNLFRKVRYQDAARRAIGKTIKIND